MLIKSVGFSHHPSVRPSKQSFTQLYYFAYKVTKQQSKEIKRQSKEPKNIGVIRQNVALIALVGLIVLVALHHCRPIQLPKVTGLVKGLVKRLVTNAKSIHYNVDKVTNPKLKDK